jgi:hypothetical protein
MRVAKEQLNQLFSEVHPGDLIVLTDGDRQMTLETPVSDGGDLEMNLEEDSPELAGELLKAARGPFTDYTRKDLEAVAERVLREKKAQ